MTTQTEGSISGIQGFGSKLKWFGSKTLHFSTKWQEYLYPQSYTPGFQILGAFMMGLVFGAYHKSFLMTIVSYMAFELILVIATQGRVPAIYDWRVRIAAIVLGFVGLLLSKYLWKSY
jgi:hypothetical protein